MAQNNFATSHGTIVPAIPGAPDSLPAPRWFGYPVWAFTLGLFFIVAVISNVFYDEFAIYGALLMVGILVAARLGRACLLFPSTPVWIAILVALAFMLRFLLVLFLPYQVGQDFLVHHEAGECMAAIWKLQFGEGGLRCYYPPGQVFTLGVIYKFVGFFGINDEAQKVQAAQTFNVLYATLTVVGLWYIARSMFGEFVGRVAGLLAAFLPSTIFGVMLIGAETPEAFWLVLALCLYVKLIDRKQKLRVALLCGLALGVGTLIRPQYMLLPIPLGVCLIVGWSGHRRRAVLATVLMGLGVAVAVLPWTIRNYCVTGGFVLISSNSGQVIYSGNCDKATGNYCQEASDRLFPAVQAACREAAQREAQGLPTDTSSGDVLLVRIGTQWATDWIRRNPRRFMELAKPKFRFFWEKDQEIAWWVLYEPVMDHPEIVKSPKWQELEYQTNRIRAALGWEPYTQDDLRSLGSGVSVGYYVALALAVAAGMLRFSGYLIRNRAWMFFPLITAYFTAVHMVFESQGKYHFMLVPLMCIFAALAVSPATIIEQKPPKNNA